MSIVTELKEDIQRAHLDAQDLDMGLYEWQTEALQAWTGANCRGVIEAVTGAGKTRLGIAAVQLALNCAYEVLVVVPTRELLYQWHKQLSDMLDVSVGIAGDGNSDWFDQYDVIVSTIHTAKNMRHNPAEYRRLMVADECHRYAAEGWAQALTEDYEWRLGLTATYERPDGLHETTLDKYFDGVIFRLWYERALAEGLIAEFDIAFVAVELPDRELHRYYELEERRASIFGNLQQYLDDRVSDKELMPLVNSLADSPGYESPQRLARAYRKVLTDRRLLLAESTAKLEALKLLGESVREAQGALVFTDTQESAQQAALALGSVGSTALAVYSELERDEREHAIRAFRDKGVSTLVAPKILDEGVDVPDADLGILLATNRSRRQLVQRVGRVLRKKADGRHARIVIMYARGTNEDPVFVGEENLPHLHEIVPHARRAKYFEIDRELEELKKFLAGFDEGARASADGTGQGTQDSGWGAIEPIFEYDWEPFKVVEPELDDTRGEQDLVIDFSWLLTEALQKSLLTVGESLVCSAAKRQSISTLQISHGGKVQLFKQGKEMRFEQAARVVMGGPADHKTLLSSWSTQNGQSLWEIWRIIVGLRRPAGEPDDPPRANVSTARRHEQKPEHTQPQPSREPIRTQTVTVRLQAHGDGHVLNIRNGAGSAEVSIILDSASAGALGGQLLSAAHAPLQHTYALDLPVELTNVNP